MNSGDLIVPSAETLAKYGLDVESWREHAERCGYVCSICRRLPSTRRLNIDHEHVRGWKAMPPARRAGYVRGLACWRCNYYFLARGVNPAIGLNVAQYLQDYADRRIESIGRGS